MMRVCHLNTCPVGVATQDPELRKKFTGKPEFVENYFRFVAEDVRELMARARLPDHGRDDRPRRSARDASRPSSTGRPRGSTCRRSSISRTLPEGASPRARCAARITASSGRSTNELIALAAAGARAPANRSTLDIPIRNVNRTVGTMLGYEITRRYGGEGLPDDTIRIHFTGSAGQSFGAFVPRGVTLTLEGDANDFVGQGSLGRAS